MGVLIAAGAGLLAPVQATPRQRANAQGVALVLPQADKLPLLVIGTATSHSASPEISLTPTNTVPLKCPMAEFSPMLLPLMLFSKVTQLAKNAIS